MPQVRLVFPLFLCVFLTGLTSLTMQVCWQKYLASLVGSDSRAQAMTVGVFLLGLSMGYWFWGHRPRARSILAYGAIELVVGLWALAFPMIFQGIQKVSFSLPSHFLLDLAFSSALILFPAFCMGATIPLLTAALPGRLEEIGPIHAMLYGFNSLGAAAGAFLGGFYLIPHVGLPITLAGCATMNTVVFGVTVWNSQRTEWSKNRETSFADETFARAIPFDLSPHFFYFIAAVSGATVIALEIVLIRVLNLTMGANNYIYPLIVGIFVLGIALGSFRISKTSEPIKPFFISLSLSFFLLLILMVSLSYFTLWINAFRVQLLHWGFGFQYYLWSSVIIASVFLLPILFFMGRVLPLAYSLIPKTMKNYPEVCGKIYFWNTIGSFCGAVILGHIAFEWFSLETIYKVVLSAAACSLILFLWLSRRKPLAAILCVATIGINLNLGVDRSLHTSGLFENAGPFSFLRLPHPLPDTAFLKDDSVATVSLMRHPANPQIIPPFGKDRFFYSVHVNGKTDGGTYSDSMTTVFLGLLPYLFHSGFDLSGAVVGLGAGVTAGLLGQLNDMKKVDVVEISTALIEAASLFNNQNYGPLGNPKVKIVDQDAFKFFQSRTAQFDFVASEPSSIWNVGSDFLYTQEFYESVRRSLKAGGLFVNWVHLYNNDQNRFFQVVSGMRKKFPFIRGYMTSGGVDMILLGSNEPLSGKFLESRFQEPTVKKLMNFFALEEPTDLHILETIRIHPHLGDTLRNLLPTKLHSLENPFLGFEGASLHYEKSSYSPRADVFDDRIGALFRHPDRLAAYERALADPIPGILNNCRRRRSGVINPTCQFLLFLKFNEQIYRDPHQKPLARYQAYLTLSRYGAIPLDSTIEDHLVQSLLDWKCLSGLELVAFKRIFFAYKASDHYCSARSLTTR